MTARGAGALALLLAGVCFTGLLAGCGGPADKDAATPKEPTHTLKATPGVVIERSCTPTGPELCFNARDDNCNGILDEGCGLHSGLVQFAIAWEESEADVDLNVTDPEGELVEVGRVTETGLVKERDCPGRRNECLGQNLENVYLEEGEPARGEYRVVVRLEKLRGAEPPIKVTLGARVGPKTYALQLELEQQEQEQELLLKL